MKRILIALILSFAALALNTKSANDHEIQPTLAFTETLTVLPTITVTPVTTLTQEPTTTPTPTPILPTTYRVVEGDTIIKIAQKFGIFWGYLADENGLGNPNLIFVGQVLRIPEWPPVNNGREIYVVLSQQKTYAIENGTIKKEFIVSTGIAAHPTVTGHYAIYVKYKKADMSGPGYYLRDVPWIMYFYKGYGLHGTYWHHNFGTPMSHGCVNLSIPDAEWLFNWASVDTPVIVIE